MSKLVDKTQLSNLAKKLDQRAKEAVAAEQSRATGVEQGLQTSINAINNETTGILAQSKTYTDGKIEEVNTRVTANASAISAEKTRAEKAEKANADAIAKLNGDVSTTGSVAKSINDALADYSNTTDMKAFVASVVNTLALSMDGDKVKLKLGGVDGVTITETSLDLCTDADIDEIIAGLDA